MLDIKGNVVKENDWVVKDEGDIAWFYKIENGKPELKANWMIGSLGLINKKEVGKVEELELVPQTLTKFLNELDRNGKSFWTMSGTIKHPFPYGKPYGSLKEEEEA